MRIQIKCRVNLDLEKREEMLLSWERPVPEFWGSTLLPWTTLNILQRPCWQRSALYGLKTSSIRRRIASRRQLFPSIWATAEAKEGGWKEAPKCEVSMKYEVEGAGDACFYPASRKRIQPVREHHLKTLTANWGLQCEHSVCMHGRRTSVLLPLFRPTGHQADMRRSYASHGALPLVLLCRSETNRWRRQIWRPNPKAVERNAWWL